MKITRLRIAGFGPYKNEQTVDFGRFDADGIFLITGKTGAGKSSILDAICFALYGSVPRFDGSELRLRSDHCEPGDPSFVELEFTLADDTYRVYRTPRYEKPKKRGVGTTTAQPDARLERLGDTGWEGIAARPVDVGNELSQILPLKQDQFLQVILLAQNRFQRFLLAKTDDRLTVLRTLFGTLRFQQLEAELLLRRKALDDELAGIRAGITGLAVAAARQGRPDDADAVLPPEQPDLDWFEQVQAELDDRHAAAARATDEAGRTLAAADQAFDDADTQRRRQDRRDTAARTLAALDDRAAEVDAQRAALRLAEQAARVWPQLRARVAAEAAADEARAAESAAGQAWAELSAAPTDAAATDADATDATAADAAPTDDSGLAAAIDALLRQLGSLADILVEERQLPELDSQISDLEARHAGQVDDLETARLTVLALPQRIDAATDTLAAATLGAAGVANAEADLSRAQTALAAAEDVRRLETELVGVHRAEREAVAANTAAALAYQHLVDRRLGGMAVELAADLVDGEPCAVCGATEHPAPVTGDAETVTEADLDDARRLMSRRQADADAARGATESVTTALTAARTLAGGTAGDAEPDSGDQLDAALRLAEQTLGTARDHLARVPALEAELASLRTDLTEAQAALAPLELLRDETSRQLAERRTQRAGLTDRVAGQLAGFATVTDRADRLQAELGVARAWQSARQHAQAALSTLHSAETALIGQLAEEGFADEAEVTAARLSPTDSDRQHSNVRRYDDQRAAAVSVLGEPDLADLPAEPVDLAPVRARRDEAAAARDEALGRRSSLGERVTALTDLVTDARTRFALATDLLATQSQVRELAAVVHGDDPNTKRMKLETYVLAAQLEEIIAAANNRLRTMTGGRYALEHDDALQYRGSQAGLGLAIRDEHTGRARATHSLSGGETFLASLALALGLAEVVSNQAGGIALDTLFVDEGFGSLDAETLETAMSTLDGLRAGGRTIGLISHVESMKEQIPAKLQIRVTPRGDSEIVIPRELPTSGAIVDVSALEIVSMAGS